MSADPTVRVALDLGAATASAALIGPIDGRRRLLGSLVLPAGLDDDALVAHLVDRVGPPTRAGDAAGARTIEQRRHPAPRHPLDDTTRPNVLATTGRERLAVEAAA